MYCFAFECFKAKCSSLPVYLDPYYILLHFNHYSCSFRHVSFYKETGEITVARVCKNQHFLIGLMIYLIDMRRLVNLATARHRLAVIS